MACLALDYTRTARSELAELCNRIEVDEKFEFESFEITHEAFQETLNSYKMRRAFREAASILSRTSRMIWKQLMDKVAK